VQSFRLPGDLIGDLGGGVVVGAGLDHFKLLRDVVVGFSEFLGRLVMNFCFHGLLDRRQNSC